MSYLIDLFLHLDKHLNELVADYGVWVYGILFLIIFVETGLVIMPFLPGDSLLFMAGALCAVDNAELNIALLFPLLAIAAVLGDTVNYAIGKKVGATIFQRDSRWIKKKHLEKTQAFFEKYGAKTIILARFVPIVRTFAPFVAGIGTMNYRRFLSYNVIGGVAWTGIFLFAGLIFGQLEVVKKNFSLITLGIIFISVLPLGIELGLAYLRSRKGNGTETQNRD